MINLKSMMDVIQFEGGQFCIVDEDAIVLELYKLVDEELVSVGRFFKPLKDDEDPGEWTVITLIERTSFQPTKFVEFEYEKK